MHQVPLSPLSPQRLEAVLGEERFDAFAGGLARASEGFRGRTLWNVNSTAAGGGVAEMLHSVLGYAKGGGIDTRWVVIDGDPDFFDVTKRIHNRLHGHRGDGGDLGGAERRAYETTARRNAEDLLPRLRPGDVAIVHDPQPAPLIPALEEAGIAVIWRCHVGVDEPNDTVRETWAFLDPYVRPADRYVFSRRAYAWEGLSEDRVAVIPPSIDALSAKNQPLDERVVRAILGASGLLPDGGVGAGVFERADGTPGTVRRRAEMLEQAAAPASAPLVTQISRWDRLKDPVGVLRGFTEHVPESTGAHLVLAGPGTSAVADDPEGAKVLEEVRDAWAKLPDSARRRVHVACLPMDDFEENAAIVNALQRISTVVAQKSLAEGFGLTVAEAMWKERPVVGGRVGGIQDQITNGETGVLVDDPADLEAFGQAVTSLLGDEEGRLRIGKLARDRVLDRFLLSRQLLQYMRLVGGMLPTGGGAVPG